jgi:hypothetical protein
MMTQRLLRKLTKQLRNNYLSKGPKLSTGDLFRLSCKSIKAGYPCPNMNRILNGLVNIIQFISSTVLILKLPVTEIIHNDFHVLLLEVLFEDN